MKYIIVEWNGLEVPFIFPCFWNHNDMAEVISGRGKPISAGFLKQDDCGNLYTTGKSRSLGVSSRPEDLEIITSQLTFQM
jgi:hypothetical protein